MLLLLFNTTRALAGAVLGQSTTVAQLTGVRSVAGGALGASSTSGRIVLLRDLLAWATVGRGTTRGGFRTYHFLRAVATASSTTSAPLVRIRRLSGAVPGWALLDARFATVDPLMGFVAGESRLAAVLEVVRRLASTTPRVRVLIVQCELRKWAVDPDSRLIAVCVEPRRVGVTAESRTLLIPAEIRSIAT